MASATGLTRASSEPDRGTEAPATAESSPPEEMGRTVWVSISILVLFVNYFLAQYDKFILSYFQADVIDTLSLSGPQYGLLSGYSTGIVYALLALPVAFVADYTSARVWTLTVSAAWWSLCVVFQGLAHTFAEVYCARLGMGIGQAAVEALSVSLISDLVAWRHVFIGESVFYVGVYVGEAISGQIATAFAATHTSWQVAMRGVGIAGIIVAVLLRIILREPRRNPSLLGLQDGEDAVAEDEQKGRMEPRSMLGGRFRTARTALGATLAYQARMHSFWLLLLSAAMRQLAGNVFGYYMPGYLSELYPDQPNLLSTYGIIVGVVGSVSVLTGGVLTTLMWNRTKLTPIYLTAVGGMVSSVFVLLMIFSRTIAHGSQTQGVMILYGTMAAAYATAETWLGCLNALIALLLPPAYKTFGLAVWSGVQVLIYSSGPEIVGLALRKEGPDSRGYVAVVQVCLATIIPVGYWACGIGLLVAIPMLRRDLDNSVISGPLPTARRRRFLASGLMLVLIVIVLFILSLVFAI